ncbi:hypothetical protein RW1_066_00220 [Rhodococcus wratislaviensis NBRC 100605]|uniref:Uncharacterized protein n=1 Tax=Rhodococcus wratislaviensis NBRC 100605 TaxID=1219028 RepID=X0RDF5_RHOWR|nr:hypothetical protein RW1_066_00220 [Rhodococcus wratislaviensis NBRC 100605]
MANPYRVTPDQVIDRIKAETGTELSTWTPIRGSSLTCTRRPGHTTPAEPLHGGVAMAQARVDA